LFAGLPDKPIVLKYRQPAWPYNGADLPPRVIAEFRSAVERCGQVTSSDVVPLGKLARQLARAHHLKAHDASEEFHKLAIDCGMWHRDASHIRDAVRKMR
jgi:hypothetical protein